MKSTWMIVLAALLLSACTKTKEDVCAAPHEGSTWIFIWETNFMWSETKCLVCDNTMSEAEIKAWVESGSNTDAPCHYVYPEQAGVNFEEAAQCRAAVCVDDPNSGDAVDANHGAWKDARSIIAPGLKHMSPAPQTVTPAHLETLSEEQLTI